MKKIFLNDMELSLQNYNKDSIKSEATKNRLIRIKCETKVKNLDNERLKKLLDEESFIIRIPDEDMEFKATKGEITYNYTDGNPFKDKEVEYTHVLEMIEYEEVKDILKSEEAVSSTEIEILKNKVAFLERILIEKGIISLNDIMDKQDNK